MNFQIGHCSTKDIPVTARYYTPEELTPPKNMLVWCYSRFGCARVGVFSHSFDTHWSPLIPKPKKGIK